MTNMYMLLGSKRQPAAGFTRWQPLRFVLRSPHRLSPNQTLCEYSFLCTNIEKYNVPRPDSLHEVTGTEPARASASVKAPFLRLRPPPSSRRPDGATATDGRCALLPRFPLHPRQQGPDGPPLVFHRHCRAPLCGGRGGEGGVGVRAPRAG